METGKSNLLKTIYSTALAHLRATFRDIGINAKEVAKEKYDIDLKVLEPSIKEIVSDLKEWNENRKEEKRLSNEEMKSVVRGIGEEIKKVVLHPDDVTNEDEEELKRLMKSLEDDFDDDDYDSGNESDAMNRDDLPSIELESIPVESISLFAFGILSSVNHNGFKNYLNANLDAIKETLGIVPDTESDTVISDAVTEEYDEEYEKTDEEKQDEEEFVEEVIEDIEDTNASTNLSLTMNADEINGIVGTESDEEYGSLACDVINMLRVYQRNDVFSLSMDKAMTLINKVITAYAATSAEPADLNILSTNNIIYNIVNIFGVHMLDAVSLVAIFTLFGNEENSFLPNIENKVLSLSTKLNGVNEQVGIEI